MNAQLTSPVQSAYSASSITISADPICVLQRTVKRLQALQAVAETIDAAQLTELLLDDPMMCLRLLADVAALRPGVSNIETITGAILMLGVEPFLKQYVDVPALEPRLATEAGAFDAFKRLHRRSLRSARLAGAFSATQNDPDIGLIYVAALMGNVDRLLLFAQHPAQAVELVDQRYHSAGAAALMASMALPVHLTDLVAASADRIDTQMHRIRLAHEFAWVLESGWSHPAMQALLDELAALLGVSLASARTVVEQATA